MASSKQVASIRELERSVLSDISNANNLNKILDTFDSRITVATDASLQVSLASLHSLRRVFIHLIDSGQLTLTTTTTEEERSGKVPRGNNNGERGGQKKEKKSNDAMHTYRQWVLARLGDFTDRACEWLQLEDVVLVIPALTTLMQFVKREGGVRQGQPTHFGNELFMQMVTSFARCGHGLGADVLEVVEDELLGAYADVQYYMLRNIKRIADAERSRKVPGTGGGEDFEARRLLTHNLVSLLMRVDMPDSEEFAEDGDNFLMGELELAAAAAEESGVGGKRSWAGAFMDSDDEFEEEAEDDVGEGERMQQVAQRKKGVPQVRSLHGHRRAFTDCWLSVLRLPMSEDLYKRVLTWLPENVMPHLLDPLALADFLTASYDVGGVVSMLALSSLFVLITQHNLDYPQFYPSLYALVQPSIFYARHRARFFKLLNACLNSTHLPAYIVAAFVKRLCRLSLSAPPSGALFAMSFAHNMIRRHRECAVLIHRPRLSNADAKRGDPQQSDLFDMSELDPARCRALDTSLWELQALKTHYLVPVREFAATFEEKFEEHAPLHDVGKYTGLTYKKMFDDEMALKPAGGTPLAFVKPVGVFADGDLLSGNFGF